MNANPVADTSIGELIDAVATTSRGLLRDVDDTAGQIADINRATTVLAMNARVEAARLAGQSGAGFAVIAEEMARLARNVSELTHQVRNRAQSRSGQLDVSLGSLASEVREARLCGLALVNIDLIDRNLYERSCDVRWWATDPAVVRCAETGEPADGEHASRRLGQILDSYTVYYDLVIADLDGRIVANGRPGRYASTGRNAADTDWFRSALATRDGSQFGFQTVHRSPLVDGERALVYSCAIRSGGQINGRALGVLGIVFNWGALADTILRATPLSASEWALSRVCIVDDAGRVLADSDPAGSEVIAFDGRERLFDRPRGALMLRGGGALGGSQCIAHAASPGYETYRTGWHALIVQRLD